MMAQWVQEKIMQRKITQADIDIAEVFWENVCYYRERKFSWEELADKLGTKANTLTGYASKKVLPSLSLAMRISAALDKPLEVLVPLSDYLPYSYLTPREQELFDLIREGNPIVYSAKLTMMLEQAKQWNELLYSLDGVDLKRMKDMKPIQKLYELCEDCGLSPEAFMAKINALYENDKLGF